MVYQLQKETQIYFKIYAFAIAVRAVIYSFFSDIVYRYVFPEGHISISDKNSGIVAAIFLFSFGVIVFSASYSSGKQLRRNTLSLIVIELFTFTVPLAVMMQGMNYPHSLTILHIVQLIILVFLYRNQAVK